MVHILALPNLDLVFTEVTAPPDDDVSDCSYDLVYPLLFVCSWRQGVAVSSG